MRHIFLIIALAFCLLASQAQQQTKQVSLYEAVMIAQEQSIDGLVAKYQYLADYWQYRSFKAQLLPSLSLDAKIPSFDRSLNPVQNSVTGEYNYVDNFVLRNSLGLTLKQNIAATGGSVELYTGLVRMDQFKPRRLVDYNSSPVSLIYNQPLGSFNPLKWDKKIEPQKYAKAKYTYLENVQRIASNVVDYFFAQLTAQQNLSIAELNHKNTTTLYKISQERFKIGAISQNELMQLELQLLNQQAAINNNSLQLNMARARLISYLGYGDTVSIALEMPEIARGIEVSAEDAYLLSMHNTSVDYQNQIKRLEAERDIAKAKADRRPQIQFNARFGLNQVAQDFFGAYRKPMDQESVNLGLKVNIFDGGMAKGRLQMALSKADIVDAEIEKADIDRRQDLFLKVMQFNNQSLQCAISRRADSVAQKRYELSLEQFAQGRMSVLEFNTAQSERGQAQNSYVVELQNFWTYFYSIQRLTLYDFIHRINISEGFDKVTLEKQ
ncbi:MAG: TolC family protein [Mucinivorans sp.]